MIVVDLSIATVDHIGTIKQEMNVLNNTTNNNDNFSRAQDITIPEIYNHRFKFGVEDLDAVFGGNGLLPGFTFCLAGAAGSMKTSFLMQCLELLERNGKNTAYISGEEPTPQMAHTAKRLGVMLPKLANMTDIDDICDAIVERSFDVVILDSLPALTTSKRMNSRQREEYIVSKIIKTAKSHNIVIGTIQHFTKSNTYKGSSLLNHSVDCTMILRKNSEDDLIRDIEVTKNRYGVSTSFSFPISAAGFSFEAVDYNNPLPSTKSKKISKGDIILNVLDTAKTTAQIVQETNISGTYLNNLLRDLVTQGKLNKSGRGAEATYIQKQ
jgi:predicted ATP-dependent serine protease